MLYSRIAKTLPRGEAITPATNKHALRLCGQAERGQDEAFVIKSFVRRVELQIAVDI